jgi:hypothetical protein
MIGGLTTGDEVRPSTTVDVNGTCELVIGERSIAEMSAMPGDDIEGPGLWEAQGYLGLDGTAWCRCPFDLTDASGWWTVHFGP